MKCIVCGYENEVSEFEEINVKIEDPFDCFRYIYACPLCGTLRIYKE